MSGSCHRPDCGTVCGRWTSFDTGWWLLSRRGVACGTSQPCVNPRGTDAYIDASTFSLTRPVDGRASDPEQVGELSGAVLTTFEESDQVRFLPMIQLGLLTTQAPLGLGDLHPFPGTQPNQIRTQPPSPAR